MDTDILRPATAAAPQPAVERREALIASTLVAAVFIVIGYATGLGITQPRSADAAITAPNAAPPGIDYVVPAGPDMTLAPVGAAVAAPASGEFDMTGGVRTPQPGHPASSVPSSPATAASAGSPATPTACGGVSAAERGLLLHLEAGHLDEGPAQQLADILNPNQYIATHTALLGSMVSSVIGGVTDAQNTFLQHLYAGHLGESPAQQLADLLNADQYTATHAALAAALARSILGTC